LNPIFPPHLYKKITILPKPEIVRNIHINVDDIIPYTERIIRLETPIIALPNSNSIEHLVNNGQSVHISSINKAICNSITIINELASKHPQVENPLDYMIKPKNVLKRVYDYIFSMYGNEITYTNPSVLEWFNSTEIHSLHQITFAALFEKVVRIIIHHEHKEGLIERLREELTEAMGLCFTGRMNRLVNSLSGIVEGIKVSFSIEEQIQLESQKIIERLTDKTITLEKAKKEMLEIFNDEDIIKDAALMQLKDAYVNALEDFSDDAEAIDL
jgi:hypothetical protein